MSHSRVVVGWRRLPVADRFSRWPARPGVRRREPVAGEEVHGAAHAGRPAGSAGLLDERHLYAARTARRRDEGVLHAGRGLAAVIKAAAEREAEQTEPGTIADVHYDFTQFGLDRSQSTVRRRTCRPR